MRSQDVLWRGHQAGSPGRELGTGTLGGVTRLPGVESPGSRGPWGGVSGCPRAGSPSLIWKAEFGVGVPIGYPQGGTPGGVYGVSRRPGVGSPGSSGALGRGVPKSSAWGRDSGLVFEVSESLGTGAPMGSQGREFGAGTPSWVPRAGSQAVLGHGLLGRGSSRGVFSREFPLPYPALLPKLWRADAISIGPGPWWPSDSGCEHFIGWRHRVVQSLRDQAGAQHGPPVRGRAAFLGRCLLSAQHR